MRIAEVTDLGYNKLPKPRQPARYAFWRERWRAGELGSEIFDFEDIQ
jgi:hypothetical protein